MDVFGIGMTFDNYSPSRMRIKGQFHDYPSTTKSTLESDIFVKTIEKERDAVQNTKKIMDDVILKNLDPKTAIINNFDEEAYPNGIVDEKGKICVKNPELNKMFKTLAETIPNYGSIYGRRQHSTHQYTLDVHTFKVLKECINNPKYNDLSDNDKLILQMTVLLHDIAKPPFVNDRQHPEKSAVMAEKALESLDFPKSFNKRIVNLVKNHGWLEFYNNGNLSAKDVLALPVEENDFDIMAIISEGDTKSVNDWFYDVYCSNLPQAIEEINKAK